MDERVQQLPIPPRFTEKGEGPHIIVTVSGGVVQDVEVKDGPARVHVHDYDVGDAAPGDPDIQIDSAGRTLRPGRLVGTQFRARRDGLPCHRPMTSDRRVRARHARTRWFLPEETDEQSDRPYPPP